MNENNPPPKSVLITVTPEYVTGTESSAASIAACMFASVSFTLISSAIGSITVSTSIVRII